MTIKLIVIAFLLSYSSIEIKAISDWKYRSIKTKSGVTVTYTVVLPKDYNPQKKSTTLLALPPGGQGKYMVEYALNNHWAKEGNKR